MQLQRNANCKSESMRKKDGMQHPCLKQAYWRDSKGQAIRCGPQQRGHGEANQLGTKPRAINMQGRALLEGSYGGLQEKKETTRKRNDGENEGVDEGGTEIDGVCGCSFCFRCVGMR